MAQIPQEKPLVRNDELRNRVLEVFSYDQERGELYWRYPTGNKVRGAVGYVERCGHRRLMMDGKRYFVHRLIWLIEKGFEPPELIDHINRNPDDNRIENLRLATNAQNLANSRKFKNNTSGAKGVRFYAGKWDARISKDNKLVYLGRFEKFADAKAAYNRAAIERSGDFANLQ